MNPAPPHDPVRLAAFLEALAMSPMYPASAPVTAGEGELLRAAAELIRWLSREREGG